MSRKPPLHLRGRLLGLNLILRLNQIPILKISGPAGRKFFIISNARCFDRHLPWISQTDTRKYGFGIEAPVP